MTLLVSPRPYKVKRWVEFLGDVRQEGDAFKEVLRMAALEKERTNVAFSRASQRSFNAIHNVTRKSVDMSKTVPRLSRPRTRQVVSREAPHRVVLEFDVRKSNHDRWPNRNPTRQSQRVFCPTRLADYAAFGGREKDVFCISGVPAYKDRRKSFM
jgi:hypothetical protein